MKYIVTWFVKNPVAANLLMLMMFVLGIFGYNNLEREFIPQTTVNQMSVSVSWPGASPRDVVEQLVVRIEEAVEGLDGIDYIEGNAREGSGSVTITTKLGIDYEKLFNQVQGRVESIPNLPPDAFRPEVARTELRADIMYLALHGDVDALTLQRAGEDLRRKLTQLTGLQLTNHISKIEEQVTIEVSEESLRLLWKQAAGIYSCAHGLWLIIPKNLARLLFANRKRAARYECAILRRYKTGSKKINLTTALGGIQRPFSKFYHQIK